MDRNKKNIIFFLLLTGFLICLCSCASTAAGRKKQLYVWLAENAKFILLPPDNIENSIDNHQLFTASYSGRSYQLIAWVKADETGLDMTFINEFGAGMGELSYYNGTVSFSSSVFPKFVEGEYIVADFQLCFYDTLALRKALKDCGLSFDETETGRRVLQGKTLVIEIEKTQNAVKLINHLRGYTYILEGSFE